MVIELIDLLTDEARIFEGAPQKIEDELRVVFPSLMRWVAKGDLNGVLRYVNRQQTWLARIKG